MKSLSLLTLLAAGLMLSGCVSDESSFGTVPGPSGSTTVASASSAPEELPSGPPRDLSDNPPPPSEEPAATRPAPQPQPAPAQTRPKATKPVKAPAKKPVQPPPSQSIVTADSSLTAKVVTYNAVGRFVVLSFPVGQMARTEQSMSVYRNGMKVGELRITGPQRDNNIVADVVKGEVQAGDEVRER